MRTEAQVVSPEADERATDDARVCEGDDYELPGRVVGHVGVTAARSECCDVRRPEPADGLAYSQPAEVHDRDCAGSGADDNGDMIVRLDVLRVSRHVEGANEPAGGDVDGEQ